LSVWQVYQNKWNIILLASFFALYYLLNWLRPIIGIRMYFMAFGTLLIAYVGLVFWQVRKIFPLGGIGSTTQKTISVPYPYEHVCKATIEAVKDCGWKVTEANPDGNLKGRIGRSINTLYGQLFTIDVKKVDESSTKIDITCSALYQLMDFGQNNEMIDKFRNWLINRLSGNLDSIPR
jgi:hypothetical protein